MRLEISFNQAELTNGMNCRKLNILEFFSKYICTIFTAGNHVVESFTWKYNYTDQLNRAARFVTRNYTFEEGSMTGILEQVGIFEEKEDGQST